MGIVIDDKQEKKISSDNPIVIIDTPLPLSQFIRKYELTKTEEGKSGLTRYTECILEVARMVENSTDPEDGNFVEAVSSRIDEACEYIGAYKDPRGVKSSSWASDQESYFGPNYYTDAVHASVELIKYFQEMILKFSLRNVQVYIPYLNDYQLQLEIYRL